MDDARPPLGRDQRPPVALPRFDVARRGYRPLEVDRWVASVTARLQGLVDAAAAAELRLEQAEARAAQAEQRARVAEDRAREAEARAATAEARGISARLDVALRTVLDEAGKATDAVLAEARARAVELIATAQQQSELVVADAAVKGEVVVARRRQEVDEMLADRLAEQQRLADEVEVLRAVERLAAGSARSVLDQLGAVAASLDPVPDDHLTAGVVIDLTEGSQADAIEVRGEPEPLDGRTGGAATA